MPADRGGLKAAFANFKKPDPQDGCGDKVTGTNSGICSEEIQPELNHLATR